MAQALNYNSGTGLRTLVTELVNGLNGRTLAASMNANGYNMTVELLNTLSATKVAQAANASIGNTNSLLRNFGIGMHMKAKVNFIFWITMTLQGEAYVTQMGEGALPNP